MKTNRHLIFWAFLLPMLAACGGGGGGGGGGGAGAGSSADSVASLSNIGWPVSPAEARQKITGSTVPTQSAAQSIQEINSIFNNANNVVVSDMFGSIDDGSLLRIPVSCSGLNCSITFLGETISFQLEWEENSGHDVAELQPVMVHNNVSIGQVRSRSDQGTEDQAETLAYGGWMEYSVFAVEVASFPTVANPELVLSIPYSAGNSTGTNPSVVSGMTGTWTGAVVGMDYSVGANRGNIIHGEAIIEVDFAETNVDVGFSSLVDLNNPNRSIANMDWSDIPVSNGQFADGSGSNQVKGRFYGPNHEEVGGIFDRNQISGAFGAIRGRTQ